MEQPDRLPIEYRRKHNEQIEQERKEWHRRKREESDEYRDCFGTKIDESVLGIEVIGNIYDND